jgi:hypothetical protein
MSFITDRSLEVLAQPFGMSADRTTSIDAVIAAELRETSW